MPKIRKTDLLPESPPEPTPTASDPSLAKRLLAFYPVLDDLADDIRAQVLSSVAAAAAPNGTVLFDEHQPCRGFPFLIGGSVRVSKLAPNGRELPLYRVLPGETCIISSSCLLGHTDYNARGVAEGDTTLVLLPRTVFDALLATQPFRDYVFRLFSERIGELMQLVEEVAFRKLDQRLAALLLGKGRYVRMTHQQLADELGSVREIVTRLLKGFAEQHWVSLSREQIEILEAARLRQFASDGR